MRICTISLAAVVAGIVLGALFVFSGSTVHVLVTDRAYYSVTMITTYTSTPADLEEPKEEPPGCVASIPTHSWTLV